MGPSTRLCEGQSNTCINKNTCTLIDTNVVTQLLSVGGWLGVPSWELVVFQQWSEHVRKCAYTTATHACSTVLWSKAVLQCLRRLQIKHTITYRSPVATIHEGCNTHLKSLPFLVTFCVCVYACVFLAFNVCVA